MTRTFHQIIDESNEGFLTFNDLTAEEKLNFIDADKRNYDLRGMDFTGADIRGVSFHGCNLDGVCFREADISGTNFVNAMASGCDFQGVKGDDADFSGAVISESNFDDTRLINVKFTRCVGHNVGFIGANLHGSSFEYANMNCSNFGNSFLDDASIYCGDFCSCNFGGASMINTDVKDAKFKFANLMGTDFNHVKGLPAATPIKNLDSRILEIAELFDEHKFDMCDTTLCRAGNAAALAGSEGKRLVADHGWYVAGCAIYKASTGDIPDFFGTNAEAIADMAEKAEIEKIEWSTPSGHL